MEVDSEAERDYKLPSVVVVVAIKCVLCVLSDLQLSCLIEIT